MTQRQHDPVTIRLFVKYGVVSVLVTMIPPLHAESPMTQPSSRGTVATVLRERLRIVERFVQLAGDSASTDESRCYAIYALGGLRASEAVPMLIANLDFRGDTFLCDALPPFGKFPAAEALVRIGNTAVEPLLQLLEELPEADSEKKTLAARTLLAIDGREVAIARIEARLKARTTPEKERRLLRALESTKGESPLLLPGERPKIEKQSP
jgi:hypothetical protein